VGAVISQGRAKEKRPQMNQLRLYVEGIQEQIDNLEEQKQQVLTELQVGY
jgi:hypothetical protein